MSRHPAPSQHASAGVVTFNPDIERLRQNLDSVCTQVDTVLIFDNGSVNQGEVLLLACQYQDVELIPHQENAGIAHGLNVVAQRAVELGFAHMLFLDQDSIVAPGMVDALLQYSRPGVGIVCPQIVDRNRDGVDHPERFLDHKVFNVTEAARKGVITSGSLVNLDAFAYVGGCDDAFFIDYVDYDLNRRLLLEGFTLVRTGETYLLHEIGRANATWLRVPRRSQDGTWKIDRFYSFGHSPFRCYYKARNRVLYSKKYRHTHFWPRFEGRAQIIPQIVLTVVFERDRRLKLAAFMKGIRDGERTRVAEYVPTGRRNTLREPTSDVEV